MPIYQICIVAMTKKLYKHIGIFVDKVCTGMKFVPVSEKSTKKEDFSVLEKFIIHSLARLFCFQLHSIIHTDILL